ncbi:MAG: paraquat-inducible protein A [Rhodospirillales bacterium]|nr:paraquat-inducible protein A [Rhodospirillales bacterium]
MTTPHPNSLAATVRGPDRLLGWLVLVAAVLLLFGWTLPIMTVNKLWFLKERISILEGAAELWQQDSYLFFAVIVVFSILFPILKLALALYLWYRVDARSARLGHSLGWIERLGRWSMLDVFVVALTVVAIKISIIADVAMHWGIYAFTGAIVLSLAAVQRMTHLARRMADEGGG